MITLTIDGQQIQTQPNRTLLETAREHAIRIPTLCYHEALKPYGGCRLCVVELETPRGPRLVAACTHPCEEGAVVRTNTEIVRQTRQVANRVGLTTITPQADLASSKYCLANPAAEYLVYLPGGGRVSVDLAAADGELAVAWFAPPRGRGTPGGKARGGARREFTAPSAGDALLHLS